MTTVRSFVLAATAAAVLVSTLPTRLAAIPARPEELTYGPLDFEVPRAEELRQPTLLVPGDVLLQRPPHRRRLGPLTADLDGLLEQLLFDVEVRSHVRKVAQCIAQYNPRAARAPSWTPYPEAV